MAEIKDDGGPAFGHAAENGHCCGATLRDYFAGQFLASRQIVMLSDIRQAEGVAWACYAIADAMIAERKK